MDLISVVIPVYNVEKYLKEALESIIYQEYKNLEIIIINDGSTDTSLEIVKKYMIKDKRIKLIDQKNKGQSKARNRGIEVATGDYIYFFDSDDILAEQALYECYKKIKNSDLDLVVFDGETFGEKETPKKLVHTGLVENEVYKGYLLLKKECYQVSPCRKFIKTSVLKNNNLKFYNGIIHEDELFAPLLYLNSTKVGYIKKIFFYRRVRVGSIMRLSKTEKNIVGYLTVARELKKSQKKLEKIEKELIKMHIRLNLFRVIEIAREIGQENYFFKILKTEFRGYKGLKLTLMIETPMIFEIIKKVKLKMKEYIL